MRTEKPGNRLVAQENYLRVANRPELGPIRRVLLAICAAIGFVLAWFAWLTASIPVLSDDGRFFSTMFSVGLALSACLIARRAWHGR